MAPIRARPAIASSFSNAIRMRGPLVMKRTRLERRGARDARSKRLRLRRKLRCTWRITRSLNHTQDVVQNLAGITLATASGLMIASVRSIAVSYSFTFEVFPSFELFIEIFQGLRKSNDRPIPPGQKASQTVNGEARSDSISTLPKSPFADNERSPGPDEEDSRRERRGRGGVLGGRCTYTGAVFSNFREVC